MTAVQRVTITAADGGHLAAEYRRAGSDELASPAGRPCVVMAHGVGATRDCGLSEFATALAAAGVDVLTFDYRHFAESTGTPRQLVDLDEQLADYHSTIGYVRALSDVDSQRIVVWGVSLSGGHVVNVAAHDPAIAAVISLTPAVDGFAAVRQMVKANGLAHIARLMRIGLADAFAAALRRPAVLAPIVDSPGRPAALCSPGAVDGMRATAGPTWRNAIAARIFLRIGSYRPVTASNRVQCPVLVQIADGDRSAPPSAATAAAQRLRATVHHYPCDHFDVYPGASLHNRVVQDQVRFLRRVMSPTNEAVPA
ncbi:alpha/beta hydrolase [Mycobacterium sp. 852013-50091_SCH5140682]|uniref:alpha/beta hydrolase n=1 Tax=Mycobacterium sp. 852013-50091_SCH5140682 TaxID=1834109 RepID=UPI0009EF5A8F|nr:alpha/beta hydrolase [Mycobacterium sp. 852013-50091_SCH5140682]